MSEKRTFSLMIQKPKKQKQKNKKQKQKTKIQNPQKTKKTALGLSQGRIYRGTTLIRGKPRSFGGVFCPSALRAQLVAAYSAFAFAPRPQWPIEQVLAARLPPTPAL
ncbi:MAG: hypothetical protein LBT59_28360 [Clostridiales bacterium]|jgi:ribosomal protein L34E|nr:hypothetical protein [Clostridiales bacterium]